MNTLIIIPTLNESKNLEKLIKKIYLVGYYDILVIDDNSKDGSQIILKKLKLKYKKFNYIIRKEKKGIGSAHLEGILHAYKKKYKFCITLDADGTHNPREIKKILNIIVKKKLDVVNTSRFLKKNSLSNWPQFRKILTLVRYILVKRILNISFDSSSGFRCYNLENIKIQNFIKAENNDYFFLIEIIYILRQNNYKVLDIPIKLKYRTQGKSKMKLKHIILSLINLVILRFRDVKV